MLSLQWASFIPLARRPFEGCGGGRILLAMSRGADLREKILLAVIATLAASCVGPGPQLDVASPTPRQGGTLRLGLVAPTEEDAYGPAGGPPTFPADPAFPNNSMLFRCCLARTLLAYPGLPTEQGGTVLVPDLAERAPDVSSDGLTWSFHLRSGIRFQPPFDQREILAGDFVYAAERSARISPENPAFNDVEGVEAFRQGEAKTITGLQTPDDHTLVIHLTRAYGGFGTWLTDASWAPIPSGAADGHDQDWGRSWISTGPYMSTPYPWAAPPGPYVLVRNPSWDRNTDPIRSAWVDRITIGYAGGTDAAFGALGAALFDVLDAHATASVVDRYRSDPGLRAQLATTTSEAIYSLPMNIAVPPFDDIAVRRAMSAVIDRSALGDVVFAARIATRGPQPHAVVVHHLFPESITSGLLLTYDPFPTTGDHGDVARARSEMSQSRYDTDHDGTCDAPVCRDIEMPAADPTVGALVAASLAKIGIHATVVATDDTHDIGFVTNHTAIQADIFLWGYALTGSDLAVLFHGGPRMADESGGTLDVSLLGASSEQLRSWGYAVTSVPSLDDVIDRCDIELGHRRAECWAMVDQLVTEHIVPAVPLFAPETASVVSSRVASFALDQSLFGARVALDRVALYPDAAP
jgi:ABC-type transport system substrate-binding protein